MAARLTDKQKKKIIADYVQLGSYRAAAKKNGVSADSVKRAFDSLHGFAQKAANKKEENTADILAYMQENRDRVCGLITLGLDALPEKIKNAKTATEITTALGTLIDKWTAKSGGEDARGGPEDDPITRALKGKYGDTI